MRKFTEILSFIAVLLVLTSRKCGKSILLCLINPIPLLYSTLLTNILLYNCTDCSSLPRVSKFKPRLSPMVEGMSISKTIEIHALTKEMERNNQKVYSLCVGEPDYQPPSQVLIATVSHAIFEN